MQIVDLTHPLWDEMPVYPGLARPSFRPIANVEQDGYAMSEDHLLNHIGTHVDARARVVVAPLSVRGANGGPVRILALIAD